jgi:hypothetical protein
MAWALATFSVFESYTQSVGLPGRRISPVAKPLLTNRTKETRNKHTQTFMPRVRFEPKKPVFEWVKTVDALVRAATVIITGGQCPRQIRCLCKWKPWNKWTKQDGRSKPYPEQDQATLQLCKLLFTINCNNILPLTFQEGRGSLVVKALCYKPESHGIHTRRGFFLNLTNPSGRPRPWGLLSLQLKWEPETRK